MITFVQIIHMATHNITGKEGEAFARQYLEDKGYRILHCNWRYRHKELDIVASDGKELVVVEVKTRSDNYLVSPLESVDAAKIKCIMDRQGVTEEVAKKKIKTVDKDRSSYYKYFTDQSWGDALNYDLCINSSRVGIEGAVAVIKEYILRREAQLGI